MSKLCTMLCHTNYFWESISPMLTQKTDRIHSSSMYINTRSRSLCDAVNFIFGGWSISRGKSLKMLATLCALLTNEKAINITGYYKPVSSTEAETLTIHHLNECIIEPTDPRKLNICFVHIPKGKSYVKKVLDDNAGAENLEELTTLSTHCKAYDQDFFKIYRNFCGKQNTIAVFLEQPTPQKLLILMTMLPHLYNIKPNTEEEPDSEHNTKVNKLFEIFSILFNIKESAQMNDTMCSEREIEELSDTRAELLIRINEYLDMFNFINNDINTFAGRLANIRNEKANKSIVNQLEQTKRDINSCENQLINLYNAKGSLERNLIAYKAAAAEDVTPLINTIKKTKAIEVLFASDDEMRLRVTAPLQYFTPADFESYERNVHSNYNCMDFSEAQKSILHKIFVTREYKLLTQSIITLSVNTDTYSNEILRCTASTDSNLTHFTEFPNPHLWHHNCWSKAKAEITKNIANNNYELVVAQIVAAVQTVNIAEGASFVSGLLNDFNRTRITVDKKLFHVIDKENKVYDYTELINREIQLLKNAKKQEPKIPVPPLTDLSEMPEAPVNLNNTENTETPTEYTQIEIEDDGSEW